MRQPNIFIRFAGTPVIACLLIGGSGFFLYGWYLGHTVWWVALLALGIMLRTFSAMTSVRRYKAWAAKWEATGRIDGAPQPAAKPSPWKRAMLRVVALIGLPMTLSLSAVQENAEVLTALHWAWALLALYCLLLMLRGLWRRAGNRIRRKREARFEESLDDPITIAVGHTTDCPTRASIERNLPDYCRQLIGRD